MFVRVAPPDVYAVPDEFVISLVVAKAVVVIAFGGDKTVSSGTFTIQFPAADATNAIIRLA